MKARDGKSPVRSSAFLDRPRKLFHTAGGGSGQLDHCTHTEWELCPWGLNPNCLSTKDTNQSSAFEITGPGRRQIHPLVVCLTRAPPALRSWSVLAYPPQALASLAHHCSPFLPQSHCPQ